MRDQGPTNDDRLQEVFEDLEQQAQGMQLSERDEAVAELGVAEYAAVDLLGRLHGSVGQVLSVRLPHGLRVRGELERVGSDFCILGETRARWLVCVPALLAVDGLSARVVDEVARPALARLSMRSALRRLGDDAAGCVVHLVDGDRMEGRPGRVGSDFFVLEGSGGGSAVPFAAVAAVRVRR
ncbi:hypothetical protein [Nocardioides terrisoli]|uniref:hypothetical protein n=1 Tax=Nocardioides terrisoli TaxID=3388267 RepID=UPI00287B5C37|nr:hypothetical protein [Nocardioides marmorisolisilvae]